jgi:uncharacterized protein
MTVRTPGALVRVSALLLLAATSLVRADTPAAAPEAARITVGGSGEAIAPAARASLNIGIQTQGLTAAAAGAEGARLAQAVTEALRAAGLPAADLKATHLIVTPQWIWDDHLRQRRRTGFEADTTLNLDTGTLERLGAWIDAALNAGATNVSDPRFAPADEAALRHLALSRAVQNARADADIMATAAGGSLGALMQINAGPVSGEPVPVMRTMALAAPAAAAPPTSIIPGDIHVTASVTGVWRFVSGPTANR